MVSRNVLLAAIAASLACAQAPTDDKPATVEGTVTNALTGEPLLRVHVSLRGMAGNTRRNLGALTDAEGKFSFTAPAGSYSVTAERAGFSPTNDRQGRMGAQVVVSAGDKKDGVKIRLNPNAAITGRVTDADGEPMEGVSVTALGGPMRGMLATATTDEKGLFRLSGLGPGKYRVRAHPMNPSVPAEIRSDGSVESHYAQTYYPNTLTVKEAARVSVAIGAEVSGIEIQLVRTPIVRVSGTVTGPPAGERVMIEATTLSRGVYQMGAMREDGTFQLWRLDPGKYLISASGNASGQNFRSAPVEVEVAGSNVDHIELRMFPPADIAGQVEFEDEQAKQGPQPPRNAQPAGQLTAPPQPPLTLVLRETGGRSGSSAQVGADGSFKLEGLTPGRFRVSLSWAGVYIKSMRLGQVSIDGNLLDLSGGSYGAALSVLVSSATGEISGVVSDDKGPAAQVPVAAVWAEADSPIFPAVAMTGDDGSYKLAGLAPGKYKLLATEDNVWARAQDDDMEEAEIIEINRGDKVTRDLKLAPVK
jgi:protocatechuate 3,4-dioxygenase beta subunit